jgi:hypothetical protein
MYPDPGKRAAVAAAKRICAACPIRTACLRHGLATRAAEHGVWGGLEPAELAPLLGQIDAGRDTTEYDAPAEVETAIVLGVGWSPTRKFPEHHPELLELPGVLLDADGQVALSEDGWGAVYGVLRGYLRARHAERGGGYQWPRPCDRRRVAALIYRFGHGVAWRSLPSFYGHWRSAVAFHSRLVDAGVWRDVVSALRAVDLEPAA